MVDKREIQNLLKEYFKISGEITIYDSDVVDVSGDVKLLKKTENLPVQFGHVSGFFDCDRGNLTSLQGAPERVGSDFYCNSNQITSLEGAPSSVGGSFYCEFNNLTSLQGAPSSVGGDFDCHYNKLKSLQGAPSSVGGGFDCNSNQITSLEGAPSSVGGSFYCEFNNLTSSLKGAPLEIQGGFSLDYGPNLPLLRTLVAKNGISFANYSEYHISIDIARVLNQFKGQGKRGFLAATTALLKLEKELQKSDPSINIRENIKW